MSCHRGCKGSHKFNNKSFENVVNFEYFRNRKNKCKIFSCIHSRVLWWNKTTYVLNLTQQYLITPRCRVLLEKLTDLHLVKNFPAFHGTPRFITALTSVRHLSLSWASPIQSIYPHPTSLEIHLNIIRPSTPSSPQWSPFLRYPHQDPIHPLFSPIRATCPAHLILFDFITRTILGEKCKSFSSSLCNLLYSPVSPIQQYIYYINGY